MRYSTSPVIRIIQRKSQKDKISNPWKWTKKIFEAWNSQVLLKMWKKCELSSAVDTNVKNNNNSNSWENNLLLFNKIICVPTLWPISYNSSYTGQSFSQMFWKTSLNALRYPSCIINYFLFCAYRMILYTILKRWEKTIILNHFPVSQNLSHETPVEKSSRSMILNQKLPNITQGHWDMWG